MEELGWLNPSSRTTTPIQGKGFAGTLRPVAQLGGVQVIAFVSDAAEWPTADIRRAVHKEVAKSYHENLLIFLDRFKDPTQSLWHWVRTEGKRSVVREHAYLKGQSGDLFLTKLSSLVVELAELDDSGDLRVVEVLKRLRDALDIEHVTKKFFTDFKNRHDEFLGLIEGIADEHDRRWYASILLNRLMFIWFLQKKGFLDSGDLDYLPRKLEESRKTGENRFYDTFLQALFFEGFAKPEAQRNAATNKLLGAIRYLNGGLFLPHRIEQRNPGIRIPDSAFENLFRLFGAYSWNLDDSPGGKDDEINPDVLGYIFEKYINQKAFGAYYTRPEITEYLCERTIHQLVLSRLEAPAIPGVAPARRFKSIEDLLLGLDAQTCRELLNDILPKLSILDPACGSGAFLVAAMRTLIDLYAALWGRVPELRDTNLSAQLAQVQKDHPSVPYFIKKSIITDNLFGVDLMEEATEIAKLRLFLALVSSAKKAEDLEPLPNIDFNIQAGNSLVGLVRVNDKEIEKTTGRDLFRKSYGDLVREKNQKIDLYRHTGKFTDDLRGLRDSIDSLKAEAKELLDDQLLSQFAKELEIKFEESTWNDAKNEEGKPRKRTLTRKDIEALTPFHWGYEFDEVLGKRGGFDAILTNPPWDIWKPNAKEFFLAHSASVTKKNMTVKDFERELPGLLAKPGVKAKWLEYLSSFPHVSSYFRSAPQFRHQISIVNGKKAGSDINLYKLFVEQCHTLLRDDGLCGMVIPSGIYTDLGTKALRELLFSKARIDALFGLSNEKFLFEEVHHAFKFCILSFQKGETTERFDASFRINPREAVGAEHLESFLHDPTVRLPVSVPLVRKLSPDSLSVMEFKSDVDVAIAEKMLRFPQLGEDVPGTWKLKLGNEFHMTSDAKGLFEEIRVKGYLPLFEGKMIHQFRADFSEPRFWIEENKGRARLVGRTKDEGQTVSYQIYRLAHRSIASATNERTMIAAILPPQSFYGNSLNATQELVPADVLLYTAALMNSFCYDFSIRQSVSSNLNQFYVMQVRVPRLTAKDPAFRPIVERAAKLTCTAPAFADLWKDAMGTTWSPACGATSFADRAKLRAELDGLVAHLYGLTEIEFAHILKSFPVTPDPEKISAQNSFRDVEKGFVK
ncbi:MAG TPA: ATP-binding protein [Fibrobacteria bacterium]|nr:ATP-binding protein [Fibrobacteria bacterium]